MDYIFNDDGDVKVISDKGDSKWFPKHIAENERLMKDSGFEIVKAPINPESKPKKQKE